MTTKAVNYIDTKIVFFELLYNGFSFIGPDFIPLPMREEKQAYTLVHKSKKDTRFLIINSPKIFHKNSNT